MHLVCLSMRASYCMALHVHFHCIEMTLMGLIHPLKRTEAVFASDIKVGSERSGLLQSWQEETLMHDARLWIENRAPWG